MHRLTFVTVARKAASIAACPRSPTMTSRSPSVVFTDARPERWYQPAQASSAASTAITAITTGRRVTAPWCVTTRLSGWEPQVECAPGPERAHCLLVTSPEAFFGLVDRHVTEPMLAAGYAKIGEYDQMSNAARGVPLVALRWRWLAAQEWFRSSRLPFLLSRGPKGPKEHVLRVGYEGLDADGEDDERWLDYFPGTEELVVTDWRCELEAHADRDVCNDSAVPTTEELARRLRVVEAAMRHVLPDGG